MTKREKSSIFYAIENHGIITQGTWVERREAIKTLESEMEMPISEIRNKYPKSFTIIKVKVTRIPKPRKKNKKAGVSP